MKIRLVPILLSIFLTASCGNDVVPVSSLLPAADSVGGRAGDSTSTLLPSATPARPDSLNPPPTDTTTTKAPGDTTTPKAPAPPPPPPPAPPPPPPITVPADSISPTGRRPRLIWTAQKQGVWARMKQENHPLYQVLANNCRLAVNGSPRYGDRGLWCTILYQITGDVTYARAAWRLAEPNVTQPPSTSDGTREYLIENAILFDWLYPALTPAERDAAVAGLNAWCSYALGMGTGQYVGGLRTSDSDRGIGFYFGLAAVDLATAGLSPAHVNWINATQPSTSVGGLLPMGGLDPTGTNRMTARNAIKQYVEQQATGGEWFESTEYNLGTQVLLAMGSAAVRTATGTDHFPEVTQYLSDAARSQSYFVTPDLAQAVQWGDVQEPRNFVPRLFSFTTLLGALTGESEWNSQSGPYAQGLLQALFSKYGTAGYLSAEPWARFFLFNNPYAATTDWTAGTTAKFFSGTGNLYVHDASSLFETRMMQPTGADHEVHYLSDFQLYRNGEWAVTHPIGYGGGSDYGQAVNSVLLAGLSSMQVRGTEAVQSGNSWWSITGSTSGPFYDPSYWSPPPAFVRIWRRTVVYLKRGGFDIIVVKDSVDADTPTSISRYRPADQATITGAGGLVQWLIHTPTVPTVSGNTASWRTPGGQNVSVVTLSPTAYTTTVLSEPSVLQASVFKPGEVTGYQFRVIPNFTGGQVVLRHVIVVGGGQAPTVQLNGNTITIGNTIVNITGAVDITN